MKKFSIIIPIYNRENYLRRAIDSVLEQSFEDFELILVNDGSVDKTEEICLEYREKYPKLIQYRKLESNRGVSYARNRGIEIAVGDWICFLDSDDEWLKNKLKLQNEFITRNPDTVCVHGEEIWFRNQKRVNPKIKHKKGGGDQFNRSLELCVISPSTVCLRKDILFELGLFREDFPVCEDYDLWLKLTSLYSIGFIETPLINKFGGHEDQLSQRYKAMDWWRVVSMVWILTQRDLSLEKRSYLIKVLKQKIDILRAGFIKHHQSENLAKLELLIRNNNLSSFLM